LPRGVELGVHVDLRHSPSGLVHVGEGWVGDTHEIPWHTHASWELYLQLQGRSTWRVGDTTVQLGPGWLLAVPPSTPHHGVTAPRWRGRHHFTYAAVDLTAVAAAHPEVAPAWSGQPAMWAPGAWSLAPAFRAVVAESAADRQFADAGRAAATAWLVTLASRVLLAGPRPDLPRRSSVARARQLLDDEPAQPWTVTELADACGVSRSRLAELFRAEVGLPPYQYLLERRVERAAELLATTPYSVSEVAAQVGFSSRVQLARHFRRLRGVAPQHWRAGRASGEQQSSDGCGA
jgi:AraC-like DNA-binding protein